MSQLTDVSHRIPGINSITPSHDKLMSQDECRALAKRIFTLSGEEGHTVLNFFGQWIGNLRWAQNRISTGGEVQGTSVLLTRSIRGARGKAGFNSFEDETIQIALRRAKDMAMLYPEDLEQYPDVPFKTLPHLNPKIWFDTTVKVNPAVRGEIADQVIRDVEAAGLLSAGYLETSAHGSAVISNGNVDRYYPYTTAQYSLTVRNPEASASGWAGVDFNDWNRIDIAAITQKAMEKCRTSVNPVAIEPGRYTTLLESQALCDIFAPILDKAMNREMAEGGQGPFADSSGKSKIGQRILDERITVSADPMDPDCGTVPFDRAGEPVVLVKWIEQGVLKELSYSRMYGVRQLTKDQSLPNTRAFKIDGGKSSLDEMIAATDRGILVTRFNNIQILDFRNMLLTGNTRDGLWLIEKGKISKSIKNFRFTDSPLFALNNLIQMGKAERVFRPMAPAVCPAVKVRDFAFTGLMDAV